MDLASASVKKALRSQGVPVDTLLTKKDGFYLAVADGNIVIVGNNGRGTAYGILELSRMAGVSPWVWWSDVVPQKRTRLTISDSYKTLQSPSVEYRGIFLNDEDWSLQPWSWKTFEAGAPVGRIGARTYKEIFKLLLRLRANAIWPGMHGATTPFYFVPGAKETADSCAIAIGTSHCEPLMRNNVGEWNVKKRGDYNYITNRESVQNYWIERLKDAFFSHIKYQTFSARAMAVKMLEAQRARSYAMGQCDGSLWNRDDAMLTACARSMDGYREIQELTDYYNNSMAGGRWKHSMCYNPRDLYVFNPPTLPVGLTDKQVEKIASKTPPTAAHPIKANSVVAMNACRYTSASAGAQAVQALGHSMNAVSLPKDGTLTYDFTSPQEGEATLYVAVIPTQPNDKGDIRFSVSIDGGTPQMCSFREKGRTPKWKENVMRGQALKKISINMTKGRHTLTIKAIDNHVVVDQWMLDFQKARKFYVLPLKGEYGK